MLKLIDRLNFRQRPITDVMCDCDRGPCGPCFILPGDLSLTGLIGDCRLVVCHTPDEGEKKCRKVVQWSRFESACLCG